MNARKGLSLVLAGIAVVTLAFGSGAFTSVSAERGVSVAVVGDDSAYVGYDSSDVVVTDSDASDLVTVTNRFASDIEITDVSVDVDGRFTDDDVSHDDAPITPGTSAAITWDEPNCTVLSQTTVTMTVEVAGTGVLAELDGDTSTREFEVTCARPEAVTFSGANTVRADAADRENMTVEFWTTNASANEEDVEITGAFETEISPGANENLVQGQRSVVAIHFPEYGVTYVHPGYDVESRSVDDWGSGNENPTVYDGVPAGL